jgi:ABC-type branched-subunit amino acid transport system ATPase component/ABC-type branched-subunit amino acid transport system permease subunit
MIKWALIALLVVFLVALPYLGLLPGWTFSLATTVVLQAVALIGLNLIFGVVGMLAFGQAAFMALPAYIAAVLTELGLAFPVALVGGFVITVAVAGLVAGVFVRLPGVYLAVGSLGFGFTVEGLARAFPAWTGGASGLVFPYGRALNEHEWYVVAVVLLVIALLAYAWVVSGARWRCLRTIRHDELAAAVLGIDLTREKARAFTIGSVFAAAGGLFLALYVGVQIPEDAGVTRSLEQIGTILLGGAGFLFGPLVGAAVVNWLFVVAGYGARYELLIYGVAFLAVVLYAPDGIMGWITAVRLPFGGLLDQRNSVSEPQIMVLPPTFDQGAVAAAAGNSDEICLRIDNLSRRFDGLLAIDQVTFDVRAGEIFTLVGPNGAGKTTLFNIISGILAPSSGTVYLRGLDITGLRVDRRAPDIGRSFQVARLVPELSAKSNVLVRLDQIAPHLGERERHHLALAQLDRFGLAMLADRPVKELSLGQHKLIDLARAAVGDPALVLLDEPAVGLTESELLHLAAVLDALQRRGSAVLIVEHNIEFVTRVANRGIVLDSGRPIAIGPVKEIFADQKVRDAYFGALT